VLACLALPGRAVVQPRAPAIGTTLEQCQNGTSGIGSCMASAWITGNLNRNNSSYREGDFVPMRSVITKLTAGHTYTLRIGYDAVEGGLHAYDSLGSVDGSESAPGQLVVPCTGVAGTSGPHACGNGPSKLAVPEDTHTLFPSGGEVPAGARRRRGSTRAPRPRRRASPRRGALTTWAFGHSRGRGEFAFTRDRVVLVSEAVDGGSPFP
jgi:hypothetical protein